MNGDFQIDGVPPGQTMQIVREIERDYFSFAGVSKGTRKIWTGKPHTYVIGHVIDIGQRPHVATQPCDDASDQVTTVHGTGEMTPEIEKTLLWFMNRNDEPATIAEISEGTNVTEAHVRFVVSSGHFVITRHHVRGKPAALYAPKRDDAPVQLVVSNGALAIREYLMRYPEGTFVPMQEIADAVGLSLTGVWRNAKRFSQMFVIEKREDAKNRKSRKNFVALRA